MCVHIEEVKEHSLSQPGCLGRFAFFPIFQKGHCSPDRASITPQGTGKARTAPGCPPMLDLCSLLGALWTWPLQGRLSVSSRLSSKWHRSPAKKQRKGTEAQVSLSTKHSPNHPGISLPTSSAKSLVLHHRHVRVGLGFGLRAQ